MTNQTVLNLINTNVNYAKEAADNAYKGKVFVVWTPASNQIERFSKTKRGAEGYIKKQTLQFLIMMSTFKKWLLVDLV